MSIWQSHLQTHLASLEKVLIAHQATESLAKRVVATPNSTNTSTNTGQLRHTLHPDLRLGVGMQAEASSMLQEMRRLREVTSDPQLIHIYYCLALIHTLIRDHQKVAQFFLTALHCTKFLKFVEDAHIHNVVQCSLNSSPVFSQQ